MTGHLGTAGSPCVKRGVSARDAEKQTLMSDDPYCEDLVRRRDETRWLSARYAPDGARARLIALYAFHQELVQIPGAVSEPPLGEIRLQWWREALDEAMAGGNVRAHPVAQMLAETGLVTEASRSLLEAAIDARAHLLYKEGFSDARAYEAWADRAEGYLAAVRRLEDADADSGETTLLVRAEAIFGHLARPNLLSEPFQASDEETAATLVKALRPVFAAMTPERAAAHAHLCLLGKKALTAPGPFSGVSRRLRLFKAMATGNI